MRANGSIELVRDPIHSVIPFTKGEDGEESVISSPWVQRLRRLSGGAGLDLVFPSATITRFAHALGTMHIAGKAAASAWDLLAEREGRDRIPGRNYVIAACRMAGLLGDLGRPPFGHLAESAGFAAAGAGDLARRIITGPLAEAVTNVRRGPFGLLESPLDPSDVADLVSPNQVRRSAPHATRDAGPGPRAWIDIFAPLMNGAFSPARMDFAMRVGLFAGRMPASSRIIEEILSVISVSDSGIGMDLRGMEALTDLLSVRLGLFESVWGHRVVRAYEAAFRRILVEVAEEERFSPEAEDLDGLLGIDEASVDTIVSSWRRLGEGRRRTLGERWYDLSMRRNPWVEAFRIEVKYRDLYSFVLDPSLPLELAGRIGEDLPEHIEADVMMPYLETRSENPLGEGDRRYPVIVTSPGMEPDARGVFRMIRSVSMRYKVFMVYCLEDFRDEVAEVSRRNARALGLET